MTTSGYRAELVRLARTFTRTGFHDAAADAYRGWIEKLADALEASEAARRDAWEAVDVARAEAERQEAEKRRLIEAVWEIADVAGSGRCEPHETRDALLHAIAEAEAANEDDEP